MNLAAFYDEIFQVLEAATGLGLTVPGETGARAGQEPSPYVELPDVEYQEPGPGLHRIPDLGLTIVFGPATNPAVFRTALAAASTSGAGSVWAALRAHTWTSVGTVFCRRAEPTTEIVRGSNPQIAYTFHLDITGA
jgi:hypothetical protein